MVTLNLPHDNLTSMVQIFYCFGLLGSFPMQMMPVFEIFEKSDLYKRMPTMQSFTAAKRIILRTLMVLFSATLALVVPKFGLFINLIGSFACTALAFVLPVKMYNKTHEGQISRNWYFAHNLLIFFGIICGMISFGISIIEIVKAFQENEPSMDQIANPQANNVITEIDLNAKNSTAVEVPIHTGGLHL